MKKNLFKLVCMTAIATLVACGGKKTEAAEQGQAENTEQTEQKSENTEQNDGTEAEADKSERAKLDIVVDENAAETFKEVYANGDFKPMTGVFFSDDLSQEKVDEFPSKWSLGNGSAKVAEFEGKKTINLSNNDALVSPKVAGDSKNYLPDVFTFEFEYYCNGEEDFNACYHIVLSEDSEISIATENQIHWDLMKKNDELVSGDAELSTVEKKNSWNHFALSFDNGTMRLYVNGKKLVTLPDLKTLTNIAIKGEGWEDHRYHFSNVRMTTTAPEVKK